jgi:hypothetical protein
MAKTKAKIKGGKFLHERLFMRNGSVLTIEYMDSGTQQGSKGDLTIYRGIGDVFLCSVREEDVISRVSMDVPTEMRDVVEVAGGPMVKRSFPTAGGVVVRGYQF